MIKYCKYKWDVNKDKLERAIRADEDINNRGYKYLVELVVNYILNGDEDNEWEKYDSSKITEIDNGDYQGTILFLIPKNTYQPSEYEYFMTYVGYGSCSHCDTLEGIKSIDYSAKLPTENQVKYYMTLCRDLVSNIVKPYNHGWRNEDKFELCEEAEVDD